MTPQEWNELVEKEVCMRYPCGKHSSLAVADAFGFQAGAQFVLNNIEKVPAVSEAIKFFKESNSYSARGVSEAIYLIYGDLEGCDCEGGCDCKPKGWYKLKEIYHHCEGSSIGIEEIEQSLSKLRGKHE